MFKTEFKLELKDINQILPSNGCICKIYPLIKKPWMWNDLNVLDRDLKVQDRLYFQFKDKWYELVCLRGMNYMKTWLTEKEKGEILKKQKEIYEQLCGDY